MQRFVLANVLFFLHHDSGAEDVTPTEYGVAAVQNFSSKSCLAAKPKTSEVCSNFLLQFISNLKLRSVYITKLQRNLIRNDKKCYSY